MPDTLTPSERAELDQLRAQHVKRREIGRQRVEAMAKARRVLRPCPGCKRPSTARQRRKPCACGYRWPMADR